MRFRQSDSWSLEGRSAQVWRWLLPLFCFHCQFFLPEGSCPCSGWCTYILWLSLTYLWCHLSSFSGTVPFSHLQENSTSNPHPALSLAQEVRGARPLPADALLLLGGEGHAGELPSTPSGVLMSTFLVNTHNRVHMVGLTR